MAYDPYEGMFYPTLPQDTQDFPAVLSGVGRSLRDFGRGVSYLPMDLAGAASDIGNLPLQGIDYLVNQIRGTDQNYISTDRPFGGSAQLIDAATRLGLSQQPTGSAPETIGRVMAGLINPMAGARAVGRVGDITTEQANRAADALVRQITGNPQATAPQVLQETAMPFMQAVAPRPSGLLETPVKSDLGFYSALEQATIPLQNKGTGSQFLAQIEKTAGVKPEEVKWTGLDEFLKSRQNVTKQEVQDYLAANRVDLQEVRLSESFVKESDDALAAFREEGRRRGLFGSSLNDREIGLWRGDIQPETAIERQMVDALARRDTVDPSGFQRPKFSSYTLPGGENYREILLTLPERTRVKSLEEVNDGRSQRGAAPLTQERYDELVARGGLQDYAEGTFKSSHFDQPNILAHMRVNDRVVDGKKTLFIEEVQSDWHQAGRKKGYDTPEIRAAEQQKLDNILAKSKELSDEERLLEMRIVNDTSQGKDTPNDIMDRFRDLKKQLGELNTKRIEIANAFVQGVPDAPFKTTWHELSLKRAIQEASEKGYDQIAFTTGKTQAERYDLSKQVDKIDYRTSGFGPNAKYELGVVDKNGESIGLPKQFYTADELPDVVGKEVAEKIVGGQGQSGGGRMTLRGVDLQVGGEGMKGFYDQILPKSLEKLGKKFDAKVGKTTLEPTVSKDELAAQVYGQGETYKNLPSESKRKIDQMYMGKGTEVWTMDITPKMRESVLTKGQPLFAATPAGLGLLGSEEE